MDLFYIVLKAIILPLIITYLVLWIFFHKPNLRNVWMHRKLVGPLMIPLLGPIHCLPFVRYRTALDWLQYLVVDGWERIAALWFTGLPILVINNPDDIEVVLSSTKYIRKGAEYDFLRSWLQEGLLVSTGAKWRERRKLLTPTFHFKILEGKSKSMYANARKFVNKLLEENGQPFCPYQLISSCTLDVMGDAAMGLSLNSMDEENLEYKSAIGRTTKAIVLRIITATIKDWLWHLSPVGKQDLKDVKYLHDFTNKIIAERRIRYSEERNEGKQVDSEDGEKQRKTFLDTILELDMQNKGTWTNSDIREEVDTFLFEGHDTSAAVLQFALFELGQNPDVQEQAYKEQYEIFGDESREVTLADLQNMSYLERFIKECLRLYPPVPYLSRRLDEDLKLRDLPLIAAGTNVVILPFFVHRNPKSFPNPEKFDVDRFLPDESLKRHPFSYIPFSAGPRNCIGQKFAMMEMKVLLSTLLRFAKIEPFTTREEMKLVPLVILRTAEPMKVKVLPRQARTSN